MTNYEAKKQILDKIKEYVVCNIAHNLTSFRN